VLCASRVRGENISSKRSLSVNILKPILCAACSVSFWHQAAAEIAYSPVLPQFGGTNGQALTILQYDLQLQSADDAKKKAAALALQKAMEPPKPPVTATDRLISSIEAALQVRLANNYAEEIFGEGNTVGDDGVDITLGETIINYRRVDGYLTIKITDDFGAQTSFGIDLAAGL
jgi:hypothetical protein